MPKFIQITLEQLRKEVRDLIDEVADLDPRDYSSDLPPIIIERLSTKRGERIGIVDGFHRAAGMLAQAIGRDVSPDQIRITVIDATDTPDLVADAAEPGPKQASAISKIERLATKGPVQ